MAGSLVKMIEDLLANPTDPEVVDALVDPDITYVSLNFDNPELKHGEIVYMQFMEDTFGTASTFKESGAWQVYSNPEDGKIEV